MNDTMNRLMGIAATALYSGISGLVYLLIGSFLVIGGTSTGSIFVIAAGVLLSILGGFLIVTVYGLWTFQAWGRKLMMWLSGIAIAVGIIAMFPVLPNQQFTLANSTIQLIAIIICIRIITYMRKEQVKGLFDGQKKFFAE